MKLKTLLKEDNSNVSFQSLKINWYEKAKNDYLEDLANLLAKNGFNIIKINKYLSASELSDFSQDSIDVRYRYNKYELKFSISGNSIYLESGPKFTTIKTLKNYLDKIAHVGIR